MKMEYFMVALTSSLVGVAIGGSVFYNANRFADSPPISEVQSDKNEIVSLRREIVTLTEQRDLAI
jgi:hypothetical protein